MPVKIKEINFKELLKKPLFWEVAVGVLTLIVVAVFIAVALAKPAGENTQSDSTGWSEPVTDATENTLPPPEENPIGLGDFYMDGDYLACLSTPSVLGIDVSFWQKDIDWPKVKEAGVEFAMIRAGWRGSEQGVLAVDDYAHANYQGASEAGIKVGAYFFSQAISPEEAEEEANYLLNIIKDWHVEMPVVYDWEFIDENSRTANMDPRTLTDCVKAFCDTVKNSGYTPMVYFNKNQSMDMLYLRELTDYHFWLAQYDTVLNYPYKIDMWQYSESGSVPGIEGNVDIDLYFPYEE